MDIYLTSTHLVLENVPKVQVLLVRQIVERRCIQIPLPGGCCTFIDLPIITQDPLDPVSTAVLLPQQEPQGQQQRHLREMRHNHRPHAQGIRGRLSSLVEERSCDVACASPRKIIAFMTTFFVWPAVLAVRIERTRTNEALYEPVR